jgi:hypothetical protein
MSLRRVLFPSLTLSILLFGFGVADADAIPDSAARVKFDFAQHCKMGGHAFRFETTTLAEMVRELGSGVIEGNGKDAGGGEFTVAYTDGRELIRFSSKSSMRIEALRNIARRARMGSPALTADFY